MPDDRANHVARASRHTDHYEELSMPLRKSKNRLDPADAAARHARGELQLVDVREPAELAEGRIAGATHIPLGQLIARLGELRSDHAIAFICRSGARSATATRVASNAGLDAYNVGGGVNAWVRSGLPLDA